MTNDDLHRIAIYAAGDGAPDWREATRLWIEAVPERREAHGDFRRIIDTRPALEPTFDAHAAWARFRQEGGLHVLHRRAPRIANTAAGRSWRWAIAASIVLAAAGVLSWHLTGHAWTPRLASLGARQVITRNGQRALITLGDGTRVVLGVGSRLRTTDHPWGARDAYLDGEAFFEVHHDAAHPFVVHTPRGATEDLGTSFDVRAYPRDDALRVVVRDGRVAVAGAPTLGAGDLAIVDSAGHATITHGVAVDDYIGWTEGQMVFRDVPLRQALAELARWYDLDVTLTDATVGERRVSGRFADAPAARVLDAIAASAGVRWVEVGRAVAVSPNTHFPR